MGLGHEAPGVGEGVAAEQQPVSGTPEKLKIICVRHTSFSLQIIIQGDLSG